MTKTHKAIRLISGVAGIVYAVTGLVDFALNQKKES